MTPAYDVVLGRFISLIYKARRQQFYVFIKTTKNLQRNILIFFIYFAYRVSQYVYFNINQLDALNFIISFISSLYMFRAHVLIVRRSKLYYTASGIIKPIGGRPVHRLGEDLLMMSTCAGNI